MKWIYTKDKTPEPGKEDLLLAWTRSEKSLAIPEKFMGAGGRDNRGEFWIYWEHDDKSYRRFYLETDTVYAWVDLVDAEAPPVRG